MKRDAVAVLRAASQGFEDQQGQGALQEIVFGFAHGAPIDSYR